MSTEIIIFLVLFLITIFSCIVSKLDNWFGGFLTLAMFTAGVGCLEVILWDTVLLSYLHCGENIPVPFQGFLGYILSWIFVVLVCIIYNFWQQKL